MANPINKKFLEKLQRWEQVKTEAAKLKDEEAKLRKELFASAFPTPVEGTNNVPLPAGWTLRANHKITRTIDEDSLIPILQELRANNVVTDLLVRYKPDVSIAHYRALSDEARKVFEQTLVIKEGMPELSIIPPPKDKEGKNG